MIGIIGAMDQEVDALKKHLNNIYEDHIHGHVFYRGSYNDKEIVLVLSGIGKVNAAITTTLLITNYSIDYLINIGSAGGLRTNQSVGDVIVSTGVCYHDFDLTAFSRPMGQVPELPNIILGDEKLLAKAVNILDNTDKIYHMGLIVSGDQFISQEQQVLNIKKHFPDALGSEMEAASIGHTAYKLNTPFLIIRSLSDVFGNKESNIQFDQYLELASKQSADFTLAVIDYE